MIYELRIYYVAPGRMEDINNRFINHTFPLFDKLNMHVCDYFIDMDNEKLYYVMAFEDKAAYDKAWDAFGKSPEWARAIAETEANGKPVIRYESFLMERAPFVKANWV